MTRRPFGGIELEHVAGFEVTGQQGLTVITAKDLLTDFEELSKVHPQNVQLSVETPEMQDFVSDEFLLRNLLLRWLTVSVRGDRELDMPPVTFLATVQNNNVTRSDTHGQEVAEASEWFPPDTEMLTYSARFVPAEGAVADISYLADRRMSSWGVGMFNASPIVTKMVLHNVLYAEFYHVPQDGELPPLPAPHEVLSQ